MTSQKGSAMDFPLRVNERALRSFLARIDRDATAKPDEQIRRSFTRTRKVSK